MADAADGLDSSVQRLAVVGDDDIVELAVGRAPLRPGPRSRLAGN